MCGAMSCGGLWGWAGSLRSPRVNDDRDGGGLLTLLPSVARHSPVSRASLGVLGPTDNGV